MANDLTVATELSTSEKAATFREQHTEENKVLEQVLNGTTETLRQPVQEIVQQPTPQPVVPPVHPGNACTPQVDNENVIYLPNKNETVELTIKFKDGGKEHTVAFSIEARGVTVEDDTISLLCPAAFKLVTPPLYPFTLRYNGANYCVSYLGARMRIGKSVSCISFVRVNQTTL